MQTKTRQQVINELILRNRLKRIPPPDYDPRDVAFRPRRLIRLDERPQHQGGWLLATLAVVAAFDLAVLCWLLR